MYLYSFFSFLLVSSFLADLFCSDLNLRIWEFMKQFSILQKKVFTKFICKVSTETVEIEDLLREHYRRWLRRIEIKLINQLWKIARITKRIGKEDKRKMDIENIGGKKKKKKHQAHLVK